MHPHHRAGTLIACLAALLLVPACTRTFGQQSPQPNIALAPQQPPLRLVLGEGIADHLSIDLPQQIGYPIEVEGWRATLTNAFRNGFGRTAGAGADLTLTLDEVRLEIGEFKPASARIQFKATIAGGGVVLRRLAGTAEKASGRGFDPLEADIGGAVEAMYEQIARDFSSGTGSAADGLPRSTQVRGDVAGDRPELSLGQR